MLPLIMSVVCCLLCMLPPQPPPLGGERIDPFFEGFKRTARIVVPGIIEGRPANCMLDTGATISVVDLELARTFPDPLRGADAKVGTPTTVEEVQSYQNIDRNCLNFPKKNGPINVSDLASLKTGRGLPVDAILGMDYLRPFIFEFKSGRPQFVLRSAFRPDRSATSYFLKRNAISHTTLALDLPVLGKREFIIDTGYNDCLAISSDWIKPLLKAGAAVSLQEIAAVNGSGARKKSLYVICEIELLGIKMKNVPAVESELNLIGLGLMRHFDFSLDFENSVVHVLPTSRSVDSFEADASGLRTEFYPGKGLIVHRIMPESPAEIIKIQVGDELLEINGLTASKLSYWDIRELLSQAGTTIPIKVKSGDQVRDVQLPLSRKFEYPPKWKPRSMQADDFQKFIESESKATPK